MQLFGPCITCVIKNAIKAKVISQTEDVGHYTAGVINIRDQYQQ